MPRKLIVLILITTCGRCMETKETVERMIMVRTTGSDLQPEATGYIYKKESNGPVSIVKLGESEIFEQLSKLYEKPESYKAPLPAPPGPFHTNEKDENKAETHKSEALVAPVVEDIAEDQKEDDADGIADEDYRKVIGEYAAKYSNYKDDSADFDDYLKSLGYFKNGLYHQKGGGSKYGEKRQYRHGEKGHERFDSGHKFGKGVGDDYYKGDHRGFIYGGKGAYKKQYGDEDAYGKHYALGHGYKGGDHGHKAGQAEGEEIDGFYKLFDKNEYKKDHDVFDEAAHKGRFHKFGDGHSDHGSDARGFEKGDAHDSGHDGFGFGKEGFHIKESGDEIRADHDAKGGKHASFQLHGAHGAGDDDFKGRSFGYEIKH